MKRILLTTLGLVFISALAHSQTNHQAFDTIQVLLDNTHLKVTEYVSTPGKDVCGPGIHSHVPHLSILLTEATVQLTTEEGKTQVIDMKAGTTFWSEEETHAVINTGKKPARVYLVEVKK